MSTVPPHLDGYDEEYETDPRDAALSWFEDADYGLFLHYGLYSLLGEGEWVQRDRTIPPGDYARLASQFRAEGFDADAIASFADECGMNYVTITAKHLEGFCLFDSAHTTYTSVNAAADRDLIAELATACRQRGLGLFCYYNIVADWAHPHTPPEYTPWPYDDLEPLPYATGASDPDLYFDYAKAQVRELIGNYDLAGVWLDHNVDRHFAEQAGIQTLYDDIHEQCPHALVSFKRGPLGTEDFLAPELDYDRFDRSTEKPGEVCTNLSGWAYHHDTEPTSVDEVWDVFERVRTEGYQDTPLYKPANLLLGTGPRPDGSIDPADATVLRAIGERIEEQGYPGP